jgi:hypothetical protein
MTAATPPIKSAIGFLKMRQENESGDTNAPSPRGRVKSTLGPSSGFNSERAPASSLFRTLRGSRMIE